MSKNYNYYILRKMKKVKNRKNQKKEKLKQYFAKVRVDRIIPISLKISSKTKQGIKI